MTLGVKNELIALGMMLTGTRFLNIGYHPDADEQEAHQISVYRALVGLLNEPVPVQGMCLEICAGFDAGLKIIEADGACSVSGVDGGWVVSTFARLRGRPVHRAPIESLPFSDSTFDHVVGVECLICLDDPATSLKEIHRILKPGGTLTIAEFRLSAISVARRRLAAMGAAAGLDLVRMKDETAKARRSILENAGRRLARTARIPWPFRGWARELAAVPGTARYEQWERGHRCYYIAQFKRPK